MTMSAPASIASSSFFELGDLDLDLHQLWRLGLGTLEREPTRTAHRGDVVVFDENAVEETEAVVGSAAVPHRLFESARIPGEAEPGNYFFASFTEEVSRQKMIALTMQRWRTERAYEDLKGELGLDH